MKTIGDFFQEKIDLANKLPSYKDVVVRRAKICALGEIYKATQKRLNCWKLPDYKWKESIDKSIIRAIREGKKITIDKRTRTYTCMIGTYTNMCRRGKINAVAAIKNPTLCLTRHGCEISVTYRLHTDDFVIFADQVIDVRKKIMSNYNTAIDRIKQRERWNTDSEWTGKGVGSKTTIALYGVDFENDRYVVQARKITRRKRTKRLQSETKYYLIECFSDGDFSYHAVDYRVIHAAIRRESVNCTQPEIAVDGAVNAISKKNKKENLKKTM
jgi:hypothetical protein